MRDEYMAKEDTEMSLGLFTHDASRFTHHDFSRGAK